MKKRGPKVYSEEFRREAVRGLVLNRAAGCAIEHPRNALEIEIGTIVADVVRSEKGEVVRVSREALQDCLGAPNGEHERRVAEWRLEKQARC